MVASDRRIFSCSWHMGSSTFWISRIIVKHNLKTRCDLRLQQYDHVAFSFGVRSLYTSRIVRPSFFLKVRTSHPSHFALPSFLVSKHSPAFLEVNPTESHSPNCWAMHSLRPRDNALFFSLTFAASAHVFRFASLAVLYNALTAIASSAIRRSGRAFPL